MQDLEFESWVPVVERVDQMIKEIRLAYEDKKNSEKRRNCNYPQIVIYRMPGKRYWIR